MSQENVEIVRGLWQAFERFELPAEVFAEDVEWHTAADLPDSETSKGVTAIQQMLAVGWQNVVDPELAAEKFVDAGSESPFAGGAEVQVAPVDFLSTGARRTSINCSPAGSSRSASIEAGRTRSKPWAWRVGGSPSPLAGLRLQARQRLGDLLLQPTGESALARPCTRRMPRS